MGSFECHVECQKGRVETKIAMMHEQYKVTDTYIRFEEILVFSH